MDIGSLIAGKEVAAAAGAAGLAVAGALGRWLYSRAKARQEARRQKAEGRSAAGIWVLLALVPAVSGCATWDRAVIGIGDALGGSREPVVPAGYEIVWDLYNAEGVVQDVSGWYKLPRLRAQPGTVPGAVTGDDVVPPVERPPQDGGPTGGTGGMSGEAFEAALERIEKLPEQVPE